MAETAIARMSLEEFLAWEVTQEARFEFVGGQAWMMAGGTDRHDEVRGNIFSSLHGALAGKPCRVRLDIKAVCPNGRSRYPDVAVDCGPKNATAVHLAAPTVIVEVLSPSTRSTDYLVKTLDYASIPTVDTYLIVDPDEPRVDVLRRVDGRLELADQAVGLDAVIELPSVGVSLALRDVYPA
jgi:Uma2 family endonuclease